MNKVEIDIPKDIDTSYFENWTEADWRNDSIGHENEIDGLDCPLCKNKGRIFKMEGEYVVADECGCMKKRRTIRNAHRSGLNELLKFTVKSFEVKHEWQKVIRDKAVEYVKSNSNSWFVMLGQPGSGKTHLCSAIAKTFLDKEKEVKYIIWPIYIRELRNKMYGQNDINAILKEKQIEVLYIDDFLKGADSENAIELAFDLLNYRYNNNLTTIISSELLMDELNKKDAAIAGRIYQRAKEYLFQINKCDKNNYRLL